MTTEPTPVTEVLSDEYILDTAYDIFLSLASDNLDPADLLLFNLQFEEHGAAELYSPDSVFWSTILDGDQSIDDENYAEVIIGLTEDDGTVKDIFARLLLSRNTSSKICEVIWKK